MNGEKLQRVLCSIEERIPESIKVGELAAEIHMSPFHFARMFKKAMGHPPHAYITLVRMERAKYLLAGSKLSLRQIATSVGYQTQAHFSGVFHKRVGVTPRTFRLRNASPLPQVPEALQRPMVQPQQAQAPQQAA